jgi:hypothetical protein
MKTYKLTITSNKNKNVSETHFFVTSLPKNFLMDILCPLTNYQLSIEEFDKHLAIALSVEGILNIIKDIKLKTKVAKNVMEVTEGNLGVFYKRPNLDLNIWVGDSGEVRTYVNNMTWKDLNFMFPEQFKLDLKSKKPFFQGELYLDLLDNRFWKFHYVVRTDKVIYEEIVLND